MISPPCPPKKESLAARITRWAEDNPDDALTMQDVMTKFGTLYPVTSMALKRLVDKGVIIDSGRLFTSAKFDSRKAPLAEVTLHKLGYEYRNNQWVKGKETP